MLGQIEEFLNICIINSITLEQVPEVADPDRAFCKISERLKAVIYFRIKFHRGRLPWLLALELKRVVSFYM